MGHWLLHPHIHWPFNLVMNLRTNFNEKGEMRKKRGKEKEKKGK
jgi:hypothetical protein